MGRQRPPLASGRIVTGYRQAGEPILEPAAVVSQEMKPHLRRGRAAREKRISRAAARAAARKQAA